MEIVQLSDIHYEHALLSAQIELGNRDPHFLDSGGELLHWHPYAHLTNLTGLSLPPSSIVLKLAQRGRFNTALSVARTMELDMSDIFAHLTNQCIRLSRDPDVVM